MFIDAMGLIIADHKRITLGDLSKPRALAAMPFGGRYRIIDFMLSNMVNSDIISVGVIALSKYKSLMDHLGTGSSWDLDRKKQGLSLLPPYINSANLGIGGEADDLTGLLTFFESNPQKYVIIADSNVIINDTLHDIVGHHEESGADMTIMYNRDGIKFGAPNVMLDLDRRGFLRDMMINPSKQSTTRCSLGVLVMGRQLLIDLVNDAIARGENEFSIEHFLKMYEVFKIRGYEYKGMSLRINSIPTYFAATMRLLDADVRKNLFWSGLPVYTKVKDEAPTLYDENNEVDNSLISDGCNIKGKVKNSMLFRGVTVSRHSIVKNCIIMQDVHIAESVQLENVIIDKNCVIRPSIKLLGQAEFPVVIGKGEIV